ncbi:aminotransferase class I/II-fold pyridoxal phosphate-dependent enzyme [Thermocatellispora tengchongensis]|uniref:aminotransferase class I/II-fold pyridoxal phosphate-dependent enzyme n=1 Tax=Thermocatellispora tengchongensis TaxID=1073253 RepID=UPI003645C8EA
MERPNTRFEGLRSFDIDKVAAAAGEDPDVLRMENLDTDLAPPPAAVEATRAAVGEARGNSWLPFTGLPELRAAIAADLERRSGRRYDPGAEVVVTSGGTSGVLPALFAVSEPGDTVVLTDPTYAGLLQRTRLAGARPHLVPLVPDAAGWRLDRDALRAAEAARPAALVLMSPSMPSGCVLDEDDWTAVAELCERTGAALVYDAAMERILYDGSPASTRAASTAWPSAP